MKKAEIFTQTLALAEDTVACFELGKRRYDGGVNISPICIDVPGLEVEDHTKTGDGYVVLLDSFVRALCSRMLNQAFEILDNQIIACNNALGTTEVRHILFVGERRRTHFYNQL